MSLISSSIVKGCLAGVLTLIFAPSLARAQLFTLSSITGWWDYDSAYIREVDPATGATISVKWIKLPPGTYGAYTTGMAAHPTTGEFFALVESAPSPTGPICQHLLAEIDPATGAAAIIGNTGMCFASLAFHSNGTLYGVTLSEWAVPPALPVPPALFTLDTTNATPTFLTSFGTVEAGSGVISFGGSALAFNPNDGLLYRSGHFDVPDEIFFQAINPNTLAVTNIPLSGLSTDEIIALTHSSGNTLLGADTGNRLISITTGGFRTVIGPMDHLARGLVFATTALNLTPLTLLPDAEVGVAYTAPLVSGGLTPYTINVAKGAFPQGLSDSLASGALSGTPASSKGRSFTAQITDDLGSSVTGTFTIKIFPALGITTRALKAGINGKPYKATLKAAGGEKPYNWSLLSGNLPQGLSLDPLTGAITGIPTETGTFDLTFHVTDPVGGIAETELRLTTRPN